MKTIIATRGRLAERIYALSVLAVVALFGCGSNPGPRLPAAQQQLAAEVREILGADWSSAQYQRDRARLAAMGHELDPILVDLIEDTRARTEARADAIVLLADRDSPIAVPMLGRALGYDAEPLRSAAVLGLSRLAASSEDALELIRAATRDRSRNVRLNALQSLDIREVETIRALLERENDPEVRQVAVQLLSLAEARGAALRRDRRGALRTAGGESEPQIVFRPVSYDTITGVARGDLRLELPDERDIPIASSALVVRDVVPAFFSPDRSAIVAERAGEVLVVDIETRHVRVLGEGSAPRLIPFTSDFIFVRERPQERMRTAEGFELVYDVFRGSFDSNQVERVGQLRALEQPETHAGESPIRWMVVGESGEGFVLRGENLQTYPLPSPSRTPGVGEFSRDPGV